MRYLITISYQFIIIDLAQKINEKSYKTVIKINIYRKISINEVIFENIVNK